MREFAVQLERLEPLRIATVSITDAAPEDRAVNTLLDWARPQGLLDGPFRIFGYDNCQPHPNHTYTAWLCVAGNVEPSAPVEIVEFPGGLFAVMEVQGVEQIAPGWRQLGEWLNTSGHVYAGQPGLEEYLDIPGEQSLDKRRFRLYLSIEE